MDAADAVEVDGTQVAALLAATEEGADWGRRTLADAGVKLAKLVSHTVTFSTLVQSMPLPLSLVVVAVLTGKQR